MKHTFLATLIAMLFALSFVSCDKDDEPWAYRDRFYVNNLSSYYLRFKGLYPSIIPHDCEVEYGLDEMNIAPDVWVIMNGHSIQWGPLDNNSTVKDSILELKDYTLYPSRHETVKNDTIHLEYRDHHYEFTDSVLRDMKDSMKVKGILPKVVEE